MSEDTFRRIFPIMPRDSDAVACSLRDHGISSRAGSLKPTACHSDQCPESSCQVRCRRIHLKRTPSTLRKRQICGTSPPSIDVSQMISHHAPPTTKAHTRIVRIAAPALSAVVIESVKSLDRSLPDEPPAVGSGVDFAPVLSVSGIILEVIKLAPMTDIALICTR